jgi:predicted dehydrogenase
VALEAGKAVFVEKPVTLDPGEAQTMLTAAERCARPVLVDHIHLFSPAWQALKHRALAGPGRLRSIGSAGGNRGPVRPDTPALWDYGPHDVAMCLDLIGEKPRAVSATLETRLETGAGAAETILLRLSFADGVEAEILVGNAVETKQRRFTARFDGATMTYDDLAPDKLVIETGTGDAAGLDRNVEAVALPDTPPLDLALERFARAIAANDTGLESLRLAVAVVEVLAEADRALQRN